MLAFGIHSGKSLNVGVCFIIVGRGIALSDGAAPLSWAVEIRTADKRLSDAVYHSLPVHREEKAERWALLARLVEKHLPAAT